MLLGPALPATPASRWNPTARHARRGATADRATPPALLSTERWTDMTNAEGSEVDGGTESSVINDLRKQLREANAAREQAMADAERLGAQFGEQRLNIATEIVNGLGRPAFASRFASEVEGPLTRDKAVEWLKSEFDLSVDSPAPQSVRETPEEEPTGPDLTDLTDLGRGLAEANAGGTSDVLSQISDAKTIEDLERIAQAGGFFES